MNCTDPWTPERCLCDRIWIPERSVASLHIKSDAPTPRTMDYSSWSKGKVRIDTVLNIESLELILDIPIFLNVLACNFITLKWIQSQFRFHKFCWKLFTNLYFEDSIWNPIWVLQILQKRFHQFLLKDTACYSERSWIKLLKRWIKKLEK